MLPSTFITYLSGILIDKANSIGGGGKNAKKLKNTWVALSFVLNLSILFFFKYFYFAVDNINILLSALHIQLIQPKFDIILPVGISFYTFQALSYTVDVYRKEIYAERNFIKYALFVSFFPQLVAGPIERSKNLLVQVSQKHTFSYERMKDGLLLMLFGYFLKMVIADRVAILVNFVFENYEAYMGLEIAIAAVFFAVQIYGDFAGYSAIAIGAAWVMGFKLMHNFNHPYFVLNVQEFWRRWHISLSTWFRDYLYIPLGGNRKGVVRSYINQVIVFFLCGLWHGASVMFILWGLYHGLFLTLEKIFPKLISKFPLVLKHIYVILMFICGWVLFRAENLTQAINYYKSMLGFYPEHIKEGLIYLNAFAGDFIVALIFGIILSTPIFSYLRDKYNNIIDNSSNIKQIILVTTRSILIILLLLVCLMPLFGSSFKAFIYFRF